MQPRKLTTRDKTELKFMLEGGCTIRECAKWMNCSHSTIMRAQREIVERFGPITRRGREKFTRWHLTHGRPQVADAT